MELLDSKTEFDRFSAAHPPKLIVAHVDTSLEEEEEGMDLKQRIGLRGLMANRNKASTSKEVPKTQIPPSLPPPPPPPAPYWPRTEDQSRLKEEKTSQGFGGG